MKKARINAHFVEMDLLNLSKDAMITTMQMETDAILNVKLRNSSLVQIHLGKNQNVHLFVEMESKCQVRNVMT